MDNPPSKLVPALIGGCVMAILSNVPIVNMGNCLCCMWVILGGFIAAYLYQKDLPEGQPFNPGDGAIIGLLAGVFGALFGTLISVLFMAIGDFHPFNQIMEGLLDYRGDLSAELEQILEDIQYGEGFTPFFVVMALFFSLIIDCIFGLLGGIIGAAVFKKKNSPASQDGKSG